MNQNTDYTPVALYARVSSDRQDVDLSVAAQLQGAPGLRTRRTATWSPASTWTRPRAVATLTAPQFRKMIDEASMTKAPFKEILVWKFSRFTRKREHAVAFKSMLKRKGVRVVSITKHADDTPTGKLMEAIIESVDEFYSENSRPGGHEGGMREAASRGFWISSRTPRSATTGSWCRTDPRRDPPWRSDPDASRIVKRMFDMAEAGDGDAAKSSAPSTTRASPAPQASSGPGPASTASSPTRSYTGHIALGRERQGQRRPGAGGEGVSRHRHQGPVPAASGQA